MASCHDTVAATVKDGLTIALAGNPNVGKSTLFNLLTHSHQQVGNWAGKTVEQQAGLYRHQDGRTYNIVDLPGTYSLTAYSLEEVVARDFVLQQPDAVVVLVDATNLERNLYLVLQVAELTDNVVVALNMVDLAASQGLVIDSDKLAQMLGLPVVPIAAARGQNIDALTDVMTAVASGRRKVTLRPVPYGPQVEAWLTRFQAAFPVPPPYPLRWLGLKVLEQDREVLARLHRNVPAAAHAALTPPGDDDYELVIADAKYRFIADVAQACVRRVRPAGETLTEKIDRVVLHRLWGIPLMLLFFGVMAWLIFTISKPLSNLIGDGFDLLSEAVAAGLTALGAPELFISLVNDGVIKGVGAVLAFFPQMVVFFFSYSLLQDSGYIARAAFLVDRLMKAMGLHGKTFLSLIMGYSCNVCGIMASRTLADPRDRLVAILVNPLIPCCARLGVMVFITAAFYSSTAASVVLVSLLVLSVLLVVLAGFLFRRFLFPGEVAPFVMEMPLYHVPHWRNVLIPTYERAAGFIARVRNIIVISAVIIWALSTFPLGSSMETSYIGRLGFWLAPVGSLMGLDWRMMVGLLLGFVAKETTLTTLGIIYGSGGVDEAAGGQHLADQLAASISPLAAYAFLAVYMLYIPCLSTLATMYKETGSLKWTLFGVAYNLLLALAVGVTVYQFGLLLGLR